MERIVSGAGKPAKALAHVPVLLPGEKTSTRIEPAKSLYAMIPPIEARTGILDAAIWIGFAWADQPRCKAAVVVTGDDAEDVAAQAGVLALGLDPRDADVVVVKIGYLEPDLYDAQRGWMMALTPGGVDQDLERLGHTKINRPMFPFDDFTVEPDLRPVVRLTR